MRTNIDFDRDYDFGGVGTLCSMIAIVLVVMAWMVGLTDTCDTPAIPIWLMLKRVHVSPSNPKVLITFDFILFMRERV